MPVPENESIVDKLRSEQIYNKILRSSLFLAKLPELNL